MNETKTLVPSIHIGRYALDNPQYGADITSGQHVEVLINGEWIHAIVRYAHLVESRITLGTSVTPNGPKSGYYLETLHGSVLGLSVGMKVREV